MTIHSNVLALNQYSNTTYCRRRNELCTRRVLQLNTSSVLPLPYCGSRNAWRGGAWEHVMQQLGSSLALLSGLTALALPSSLREAFETRSVPANVEDCSIACCTPSGPSWREVH